MPDRCFLATFHPLIRSASGRTAATNYGLPPFSDGSCRREPDFESKYPSITATCRSGNFAPRLHPGDRVGYLTVKGKCLGDVQPGWRFVAILRVLHRFESHSEAAQWYRQRGLPLPSNCIVPGNRPKPLSVTSRSLGAQAVGCTPEAGEARAFIREWDMVYRQRIKRYPTFLVCAAEYLDLWTPPQVLPPRMRRIFGRIPGTLNPPAVSGHQLIALSRRG